MHLRVEILFDTDSRVSVNSNKVLVYHCNHTPSMLVSRVAFLTSHAPDCRQQAVN